MPNEPQSKPNNPPTKPKQSRLLNDTMLMNVIMYSAVAATLIVLAQVWMDFFNHAMLVKLLATCAIVATLAGILKAISSDIEDDQNKKDGGFFN